MHTQLCAVCIGSNKFKAFTDEADELNLENHGVNLEITVKL